MMSTPSLFIYVSCVVCCQLEREPEPIHHATMDEPLASSRCGFLNVSSFCYPLCSLPRREYTNIICILKLDNISPGDISNYTAQFHRVASCISILSSSRCAGRNFEGMCKNSFR